MIVITIERVNSQVGRLEVRDLQGERSLGLSKRRNGSGVLKEEKNIFLSSVQFSHSVMSDSVTPWTVTQQASLSITNSWSLSIFMSIELVMPSNHPNLCHPLLLQSSIFPSIRVFSNESVLRISWPSHIIGVSTSISVLPMHTQG